MLHEILKHKRAELAALSGKRIVGLSELVHDLPPTRSLRDSLTDNPGVSIIAEIKRHSPSRGLLAKSVDVARRAQLYERAGASAISVLTDSRFFHGSIDDLKTARAQSSLPILRKDFIVSEYQILEARAAGADAVLLIVAALSNDELRSLFDLAKSIGLGVLVEIHDEREAESAVAIGAKIIGINNRDLKTFTVDLATTERVAAILPDDICKVSESGVQSAGDIARLRDAGVDAALIGESLMRLDDPSELIASLLRGVA